MLSATWIHTAMCAGESNISVHVRLNTNRLRDPLFEVGEWLAQGSMKLLYVINLSKPSGYFTYRWIYKPKILHGVHIALCVLYVTYILYFIKWLVSYN
jgi:hypothetical protein